VRRDLRTRCRLSVLGIVQGCWAGAAGPNGCSPWRREPWRSFRAASKAARFCLVNITFSSILYKDFLMVISG
jgi:hypothetical protein